MSGIGLRVRLSDGTEVAVPMTAGDYTRRGGHDVTVTCPTCGRPVALVTRTAPRLVLLRVRGGVLVERPFGLVPTLADLDADRLAEFGPGLAEHPASCQRCGSLLIVTADLVGRHGVSVPARLSP